MNWARQTSARMIPSAGASRAAPIRVPWRTLAPSSLAADEGVNSTPGAGYSAAGTNVVAVSPTAARDESKRPIRMLHDRILVSIDADAGERRSTAGIVIPATAKMGRRLVWAEVVAVGGNVRNVQPNDRVLYDPEDRSEVELHGVLYVLLRERDLHAVAADRIEGGATGLYL